MVIKKKIPINNISVVGIVFSSPDPSKIFCEMKTPDYPRQVFACNGLIIGGNWIGDRAKNDFEPRGTLMREWQEEISFDKPIGNFDELNRLFSECNLGTYQVEGSDWKASEADIKKLLQLKEIVAKGYKPFSDYLQFIPEQVFRRGEPEYSKGDYWGLCSVWQCGLSEEDWNSFVRLQNLAGNLSNESISMIISLEEILKTGWNIAWGHDRALKDFFMSRGFNEAEKFPLIPGVITQRLGGPFENYNQYLNLYEVDKRP